MTYDDALRCASRSAAFAARMTLLPPGTCCGARIVVEQATWHATGRSRNRSLPFFVTHDTGSPPEDRTHAFVVGHLVRLRRLPVQHFMEVLSVLLSPDNPLHQAPETQLHVQLTYVRSKHRTAYARS